MYITITTIHQEASDTEMVENFLAQFLPRIEKQPGVVALYRYLRPEQEDSATVIIWENEEGWKGYVESPLKQEVDAFAQENDLPIGREGHPLAYATLAERLAEKG
jgi:heme-degrading monooxygenase HmoA